ncbi:hypothetical protein F310043J5_19920 [Anaerostipes hominis (ex Lee et al. 2021)]
MGNRIVSKSTGSGNWDEIELVGFPKNGVVFYHSFRRAFEMCSSNSDKKLSQDGTFWLKNTE